MRLLNKGAALTLGCFIVALIVLAPAYLRGDEWNRATKFEINQPFEVPGMVLQPNTRYLIKILDSPSTRNVVQIYNEDQTKLLTMFMAISAERPEPEDETVFTFIETQPGAPLPIKEWFYPGRTIGLEFVYPKDQAMRIAAHTRETVLSSDSANLRDLNSNTVELAEAPSVERAPVEPAVVEREAVQEQAQAEEQPVEPQAEEPVQIAQNEQQEAEPAELPRTAGELPMVALIGALCVGAGLGLRVLSARRS